MKKVNNTEFQLVLKTSKWITDDLGKDLKITNPITHGLAFNSIYYNNQ